MKKQTTKVFFRYFKKDTVRMYIFCTLSMMSLVMFYALLTNSGSPRVANALPYLLTGDIIFMGVTVACTLAKSVYVGKSYDMDHVWVFPTIGFNRKSMYIIWLRFEIFVTY